MGRTHDGKACRMLALMDEFPTNARRLRSKGLQGERRFEELRRRESLKQNIYCCWSEALLEGYNQRLSGNTK